MNAGVGVLVRVVVMVSGLLFSWITESNSDPSICKKLRQLVRVVRCGG